jgi:hypothetical protein
MLSLYRIDSSTTLGGAAAAYLEHLEVRIPDVIAEAARRAPPGSRFLVFVGRLFPGAEAARRAQPEARGVIDVPATEVK